MLRLNVRCYPTRSKSDVPGCLQSPLLCLEPHSKPARDRLHDELTDLRPQRCSDPEVTSPVFDPGAKQVCPAFFAHSRSLTSGTETDRSWA